MKAVLTGKYLALNACIKKESSEISYLSSYFRKPGKEEEFKSRGDRRKEIMQIRAVQLKIGHQ